MTALSSFYKNEIIREHLVIVSKALRESLLNTVVPIAKEIALDIPNFTDITPQIQAGIVKI